MLCSGIGLAMAVVSFLVVSLRWLEHARILSRFLGTINTAKRLIVGWLLVFALVLVAMVSLSPVAPDTMSMVLAAVEGINAVLVMIT